jgi:hypothetical protein
MNTENADLQIHGLKIRVFSVHPRPCSGAASKHDRFALLIALFRKGYFSYTLTTLAALAVPTAFLMR